MANPLFWGPVHVSKVVDMHESASLRCSMAVRDRTVEICTEEGYCAKVPLRGARVHVVHRESDGRFSLADVDNSEGGTIGFCIVPTNGNVQWVFEFDFEEQYNNWISVIRAEGAIMFDFSERIQLTRQIGRGAQSRVFEAIDRGTGTVVAVKVAVGEHDTLQALLRELDFLYALRGEEGVIMYHGLYEFRVEGTPSLGLVLERFDGTLQEVLRNDAPLCEEEVRPIVQQLVRGVAAVHRKGMVHRDIKPGNVLVQRGPDGRVVRAVLADFGLATWTNDAKQMAVRCGTVGFCAPEVLKSKHVSATSQDMFSAGIMMLFLLTGTHPFGSDPGMWYGKKERRVDMPASLSRPCLALLEGFCAIDPAERWTVMDVLDCQWLCEPSVAEDEPTHLSQDEPTQKLDINSLADPDELGTQLSQLQCAAAPTERSQDDDSCTTLGGPDYPSRDAARDSQRSRPIKLPPIPARPPGRALGGSAWPRKAQFRR